MSLTYSQSTGILTGPNWSLQCYSGYPPYRNDPSADDKAGLGPLPRGTYSMGEPVNTEADRSKWTHPHLGPYAIPLLPEPGTDTHDRSEFYMHGEDAEAPGFASHGCIVRSPRSDREAVYATKTQILVIS